MKILHIIAPEDASRYAIDIIRALKDQGYDQTVIATPESQAWRSLKREDVPLTAMPFTAWLARGLRLRRLIRREKPDIVQCWSPRGAALLAKAKPETLPVQPRCAGWLGGTYEPVDYLPCTYLVGATPAILHHLRAARVRPERARLIPVFPDIAAQPPIDRATLSTDRDAKVILCLSRLHPHKGIDTLLAALKEMPLAVLWLEGEGPSRRELEAAARTLGVIDRVRFLGPRADRAALLRTADLCVMPARQETSCQPVLEAWAAGTPAIACASTGAKALIDPDTTGLLTPVDDVAALVIAMRRVLDDENLRRRLVAQGYAAYIKNYTRESVTRQWMEFTKEILKEEKAA